MSGDYTRFTFKPRKRYSGVLMQQGRVQLDSDWNEAIDIVGRRVRTQALDTFGPAGVALLTTPNAFTIGALPGPDLSIAPGRIYVDGLLAEIFPDETPTYLNQPFLPSPPPLPAGEAVVYLDVWEREVTYIEDRDLLDVALGGADTATRTQTVWQLRADERPGATCGMPVGAPPSAGRLTTDAVAPPAPDDPCILPPIAGYRGLENRLYRVEVHTPGVLGKALFKWSRDNGSIVSVVSEIVVSGAQSTLSVDRIGRDPVLRLRIDDWVTVTDDHRELMGEPGAMARIVDIDQAARRVVLDRALPLAGPGAFGATAADLALRHTRVQRWDEAASTNTIDADGLIATAAGPIPLEDGVEVRFSVDPAGGAFNIGDYWIFAARTADASVEELVAARPRGIEHHYLQLAAITVGPGGGAVVTNCRPTPSTGTKAEPCCCIVVPLGASIQATIDALPPAGGCVCLLPGFYPIEAPILIARSNVTLKCDSDGAVVMVRGESPALIIRGVEGILISRVTLRREGPPSSAAIIIASAVRRSAIEDCEVVELGPPASPGIAMMDCQTFAVERCGLSGSFVGLLATGGKGFDLVFAGNRINLGAAASDQGSAGIIVAGFSSRALIEANFVSGGRSGILVSGTLTGALQPTGEMVGIIGNTIELKPVAEGAKPPPTASIGIDLASSRSRASGNAIILPANRTPAAGPGIGPAAPDTTVGIRLTGFELQARDNLISVIGEGPGQVTGIEAGFVDATGKASLAVDIIVAGNSITGCTTGVAGRDATSLDINGNQIVGGRSRTSAGVLLQTVTAAQTLANHVTGMSFGLAMLGGRRNTVADNDVSNGAVGVWFSNEAEPVITRNRVSDLTGLGIAAANISGRCDITHNRIAHAGFERSVGLSIIASQIAGELNVQSNEVLDTGLSLDGTQAAATALGIVGLMVLEGIVEGNLVTYSNVAVRPVTAEDRALLMQGLIDLQLDGRPVIGFGVSITNNKFIGAGRSALVELRQTVVNPQLTQRFERVLFHNNYCSHLSGQADDRLATVSLVGRAATVMGNQVKGLNQFFSFNFHGMPGPFIGNVTSGGTLQHLDFPAPQAAFNMIA